MNLIEELRSLDPRDPGRWPLVARAGAVGICFVVLALVLSYVFVWDEQRPELQRREDTEQQLARSSRRNTPRP
jgi:type IV pilus assembly protein PilO